ncbi:hypothetical protein [Jannaschia sp. LMIT008]|uniref:hypothetical protein n=1 Tax=Jannaschia maritima TaxID=3032585 RepID=UPI00281145FF|nr:hypothetical protein [Jannaschia sp. LMIT008]
MQIILNLGAHLCMAPALHRAFARDRPALLAAGVHVWTHAQTRGGTLDGVTGPQGIRTLRRLHKTARTRARVALRCEAAARAGARRLIVSDPDLLGPLSEGAGQGILYGAAGERLDRLRLAIPDPDVIHLAIRPLPDWWEAAEDRLADRAIPRSGMRGRPDRGWRHLIGEVSRAFPDARIDVWTQGGDPRSAAAAFQRMTGLAPSAGSGLAGGVAEPPSSADRLPPTPPWATRTWHGILARADAEDAAWLHHGAGALITCRDRAGRISSAPLQGDERDGRRRPA